MSQQKRYFLPEDDIPRQWFNIAAVMPTKPLPPLNPKTRQPMTAEDLFPIFTVEQSQMPGCEQFNTGDKVFLQNAFGQPFPAVIAAKDETTITFDANHELAGQELNFKIELVEVAE